jgi:iron(III) transport system substrate-binding protein
LQPGALPGEAAAPTRAAWQQEWENTVAAGKKEGRVFITWGSAGEQGRTKGFQKAYPDIKVENQTLAGRDFSARVPLERQAGIYAYDVYSSGPTTALVELIPQGILANIRPAFISPEIADDRTWIGNFDDWWSDDEAKKFVFVHHGGAEQPSIWVNRQKLSEAQFNKVEDIFKPELKGKWCSNDPRTPGPGATIFTELAVTKGPDFVRRLLKDTGVAISRDGRKLAEDLVRGDYFACVGAQIDVFHLQGVGLHVQRVDLDFGPVAPEYRGKIKVNCCGTGVQKSSVDSFLNVGSGPQAISLMDKAPHPNAARVYINYVLSRPGQESWGLVTDTFCSLREDMREWCRTNRKDVTLPEDGKSYITFHKTSNVSYRQEAQKLAQEVFGR